ncbi:MAG: prepilin-type N-terminal cleavage/methylation domain-containing protein [Actinomycetota bacterium]|nr:prepilin-type N-terminal cleavage/methylation domain-containing protein [Actinomycetota bacterium]
MSWRHPLRRLRGEGGYSLIEMLTVMVIMGVVMSGLTTVFVSASNSELDLNNRFQAQLSSRLALDKFRREVHCASSVTLNSTSSVTVVLPSGCKSSGTVTWCAQGSGTRWGLYRVSGSSCSGGVKWIDYLIQSNLFNYTAPAAGSRILPKVNVDFPVNVKPVKTTETYELKDDVVLRNGTRA